MLGAAARHVRSMSTLCAWRVCACGIMGESCVEDMVLGENVWERW